MPAPSAGNGSEASAREAVVRDARRLAADLDDLVGETRASLAYALERHPLLTLGAAATVGYVLAGGLASRLTLLGLGAGARLASASLAQHLASVARGAPSRDPERRSRHGSGTAAAERGR
jgi:hypothetical protein